MNRQTRLCLILLLAALLSSCAGPTAPISQRSFESNLPRQETPSAPEADRQELAKGNGAFALDLYRQIRQPGKNAFFSPYSISLALAMTYGGARGETARQMASALHFTLPAERLHPALNAFDLELASRKNSTATQGQGADGKGFRLNIVNDIWGEQEAAFLPDYLDLLAKYYGAGLRPMDFKGHPEAARQAINDYIAKKTEQRIKDLIPAGMIDALTRLVLTNAIYFNAAWLNPFEKDLTKDEPFTRLDGSKATVPMMQGTALRPLAYLEGDGFQAVALPYETSQLAMLIIVPDAGKFEAVENALDADRLQSIFGKMEYRPVVVAMPRFQIESEFALKDALAGLGMKDAFQPDLADLSGMDGKRDLYISNVVHKAFVKVDETGTEAAAATAVIATASGAMADPPIRLTIDRPFIFLIRDEPTGAILFVGRVVDPGE